MEPEVIERIWKIFFPEANSQVERLRAQGTRFVHYTSAESGMKILGSNQMLLRNSTMMNDFSEVQYGMNSLNTAYEGPLGERLKTAMRVVQNDLPEIVQESFNEQFADVRAETYLVSISEHGDPEHGDQLEDAFGRLSMWRAYANQNGIALVFKNAPFLTESNALNAFTSPVIYTTSDSYHQYFEKFVSGIETEIDLIALAGGQFFHDNLINAFRLAVQSTKHPSFREEREWRVIYSPTLLQRQGLLTPDQLEKIPTQIMTLNGVPQRVYAIPFRNYPDEGFVGATIPELIDRILIGPSPDAYPIAQAFVAELNRCGVEDAHERVWITGVPLRV